MIKLVQASFIIFFVGCLSSCSKKLTLIVMHEEVPFVEFSMTEGEAFGVSWIHSVEDEEWQEYFTVIDDGIVLHSTRFRTFGAGTPDEADIVRLDSGWVVMEGYSQKLSLLRLRVNDITKHALIIQGTLLPLPLGRVTLIVDDS